MNMGILKKTWILLLLLQVLWAHGVSHQLINGGIGIQIYYDDGTPLAYADVTIFSSADKDVEFQSGLTDKNGRFYFGPDLDGVWTILIDDGLGHGLKKEIKVEEQQVVKSTTGGMISRWQKILIGVSLIVGLTGFMYGYSVRRQTGS